MTKTTTRPQGHAEALPISTSFDPISLNVFRNLFSSVADEMGISLQRTAFSPNIKMRRDFSCGIFDDQSRLLAQAAHIPVHLGAMTATVNAVLGSMELNQGDVAILNDPFAGGTHLPDISLVSAAFDDDGRLLGYVTNRAHHSDVGGMTPGSMPLATDTFQEGLTIPPVKLVERGKLNQAVMSLILRNVRTPEEREGDLVAQLAAQTAGQRGLLQITGRYGIEETRRQAQALIRYSRSMVESLIEAIPDERWTGEDRLDGDGITEGSIRLAVTITKTSARSLAVDFRDTDAQAVGPVNAVRAVTEAALLYVIRTLIDEDIPVNAGTSEPVSLLTRPGTVVDALPPAAVSAGNVETSQRIVDVLFKALAPALPDRVPAASQGTMNNLSFGGWDGRRGRPFAYYETMGGGMGARPDGDGMPAVHDHMSNTLNTPVESLETEYPIRVRRYEIVRESGGPGLHTGGDGVRRDIEFLEPATVSIISERRVFRPYGLKGGEPGATGVNMIITEGVEHRLPAKSILSVDAGDIVRVVTPGGGGHGVKETADG
ncbi:MAG TPA: hydantoinase B/oxoprolinase family protein [Chloroflexota bacterium]|nr:hydantoinase B/oxoprolinase family protein [Chloroflexota bacterium]